MRLAKPFCVIDSQQQRRWHHYFFKVMLRTCCSSSSSLSSCITAVAVRGGRGKRRLDVVVTATMPKNHSAGGGGGRSSSFTGMQTRSFYRFAWNQHHQHQQHFSFFHSSAQHRQVYRDPGLLWTSVVSDPQHVNGPRGIPSRSEQVKKLQGHQNDDDSYDLLVIGGGATGTGVALDAATRGLKVACIERGDFASETSSRSTKLIWAGIKYMGTATAALLSPNLFKHPIRTIQEFVGEIEMVISCHRERRYMTNTQKHLCQWLPIVVPFHTWIASPPPMGYFFYSVFPMVAPIVFKVYDALSSFTCPPSYILSKKRAAQCFPQLNVEGLKYCAVFYEAQHNDARTNLAIALTAAEKGADICNYIQAIDLIKNATTGKVTGAKVLDRMTGKTWNISAKKIVLAAGPFTDELRRMETEGDSGTSKQQEHKDAVRGASGTHIVLPSYFMPRELGLLDYNTSDGRFMFMVPWLGHTLVGTTDKLNHAHTLPDTPEAEIEWLINETQKHLRKDLKIRRSDVLSAWRGWRPLAHDPHAPEGDDHASRDHVISENPHTGVIFIAGGKWTTWREMAEEVVDMVVGPQGAHCRTLGIKLHGGEGYTEMLPTQLMQKYGMEKDVAERLASTYGDRAWEVCEYSEPTGVEWPRFGKPLVEGFPHIEAEVVYACREYACTVEDVLSRRTRLAFLNKEAAIKAIPKVADIMAKELGWNAKIKKEQINAARHYIDSYGGPMPTNSTKIINDYTGKPKLKNGNDYLQEQNASIAS